MEKNVAKPKVGFFEAPGCVPGTLQAVFFSPPSSHVTSLPLSSHTSFSCPAQWDRILLVAMTFGLSYSVMQADRLSWTALPLIAG